MGALLILIVILLLIGARTACPLWGAAAFFRFYVADVTGRTNATAF